MVRNIIKGSGGIEFFVESIDANGQKQVRKAHFVCWVIDDNTLIPIPVVFPKLEKGEKLIHNLKV